MEKSFIESARQQVKILNEKIDKTTIKKCVSDQKTNISTSYSVKDYRQLEIKYA